MRDALVMVKKDLNEVLRTRSFYFSLLVMCAVIVLLSFGFKDTIKEIVLQNLTQNELIAGLRTTLGMTSCSLSFTLMILLCMLFSQYSIVIEKTKRTIESLLCTPLTVRQIWLSKSFAIFLPTFLFSIIFTIIWLLIMNLFFITPSTTLFVMPAGAAFVMMLLVGPIIIFILICMVGLVQFIIKDPRVSRIIFMALLFGIIYGLRYAGIEAITWRVTLLALQWGILLAIVTTYVSRYLTKERIILTSKGL